MKKLTVYLLTLLIFSSCTSQKVITYIESQSSSTSFKYKYGYLPGIDLPIYDFSIKQYDICQYKFNLNLIDKRNQNIKMNCSKIKPDVGSEFDGDNGHYIFLKYIMVLIKKANGIIDSTSNKKIDIDIEIISPKLIGFAYVKVHGLCQITAKTEFFEKTYCCDIKDGDEDAPLKWYSFDTRKSALRKMTSAALRNCIENLISDLEKYLRNIKT